MPYTLTKTWRAKWYKRPWLWLINKSTSSIDVYYDVEITSMEFFMEGEEMNAKVEFKND